MIEAIEKAKQHFGKLLEEQLERIEHMKKGEDWIDYSTLKPIIIGFISGDGIGPYITKEAKRVLEFLLKDELENGTVKLNVIEGLTIENRAKAMKAIPDDVLNEIKNCLLYTSPSPRDRTRSRMPSSA